MGLRNQHLRTMGRLFSHFISRESDALLGLQLERWVVGPVCKDPPDGSVWLLARKLPGLPGSLRSLQKSGENCVKQTPDWLAEVEGERPQQTKRDNNTSFALEPLEQDPSQHCSFTRQDPTVPTTELMDGRSKGDRRLPRAPWKHRCHLAGTPVRQPVPICSPIPSPWQRCLVWSADL